MEIEALIERWLPDAAGRSPLVGAGGRACGTILRQGISCWSRAGSWATTWVRSPPELPEFVIQPMSDAAVRRFCENWAGATGLEEGGEALATALLKHPNPYVGGQMARNPLLLTILAQVYNGSPERRLPARRVALYERAQEAVFRQREEEWGALKARFGTDFIVPILERATAYVAFQLHEGYSEFPHALAPQERVEQWLLEALADEPGLSGEKRADVAGALLDAANALSGFFVARGEGVYGFLHRQFQEYFAARHLLRLARGRRGGMALFWERYGDTAWREVLLMAVGLGAEALPDATRQLLDTMLGAAGHDPTEGALPYNALLAAAALREVAEPLRDRAWRALVEKHRGRADPRLPPRRRGALCGGKGARGKRFPCAAARRGARRPGGRSTGKRPWWRRARRGG